MKSFVSFLKNTKDSIVDSTQNLFGKKKDEHKDKSDKMEEEDPPESKQRSIFDEETYYNYLNQATDLLGLSSHTRSGDNKTFEYLYELTSNLSYKEIIKIRQIFSLQRRIALNDFDHYCRIIQTELNYEQLIYGTTLSFLTQKMGIDNYSLGSMRIPLEQVINKRVCKEMCKRVLFSKEEILTHLDTYKKVDMRIYNLKALQYHSSPLVTIERLLNDVVGLQTGIDEEELYCFKLLFDDDNEVQEEFTKKDLFLQQIVKNIVQQ